MHTAAAVMPISLATSLGGLPSAQVCQKASQVRCLKSNRMISSAIDDDSEFVVGVGHAVRLKKAVGCFDGKENVAGNRFRRLLCGTLVVDYFGMRDRPEPSSKGILHPIASKIL